MAFAVGAIRASIVLALPAFALGCGALPQRDVEQVGTSQAAITQCGQTSLTGIDVYHGDNGGNTIDWNAVKQGGMSFGFAKATESTDFNDPMFAANWSGMKAAGLVRGAYHFFDPAADAAAQATFFLQAVTPVSPGDLLVLDFETNGGESDATLAAAAVTFLSMVASATGQTPLLYASSEFLSDFGPLGVYPLWVANYGVSCPDVPAAWQSYTFWQSSGSGSAPGISGAVDVDSFNGTLAQLQALGQLGPADAGMKVPDPGIDSGTVIPPEGNDSGIALDSGTVAVVDSGAGRGAGTGGGSGSGDGDNGMGSSGGGSATGTGTGASGGQTTTSNNEGPDEFSAGAKGCSAGGRGGSPTSGLAMFIVALAAVGSRRRVRRG